MKRKFAEIRLGFKRLFLSHSEEEPSARGLIGDRKPPNPVGVILAGVGGPSLDSVHRSPAAELCKREMLLRSYQTYLTVARHFSIKATVGKSTQTATTVVTTSPRGRDTLGRRLLSLVYPKRSAVIAINKWKEEGHTARKYELNRIVRELRKLKRYKHALEVGSLHFSLMGFYMFTIRICWSALYLVA